MVSEIVFWYVSEIIQQQFAGQGGGRNLLSYVIPGKLVMNSDRSLVR